MKRSYEGAAALMRNAAGPLAADLGPFVASLSSKQYAVDVVYVKARHALAFDRWLAKRRIVLGELGETNIERYQRRNRRLRRFIQEGTRRGELRDLTHLLCFLRAQGVCETASSNTAPADDLAAQFGDYLQHQKGLANASVERYSTTALQFLRERFEWLRPATSALR